jgi:hypothetical protein
LQHDWWDGTRWNHGSLFPSNVLDRTSGNPDNAATVYKNQLQVFSRDLGGLGGGLGHAWLG